MQPRVPLRLLAAGARLLFAPGDLGNILFFFQHIVSKKVRAGQCDAPVPAPSRGAEASTATRARVPNSCPQSTDLSHCVVCVPALRA